MKLSEKRELVLRLFDKTSLTYEKISNEVGVGTGTVSRWCTKYFGKQRCKERFHSAKSLAVTGDKHPNYKTGRSVQGSYATVLKPEWYTGRKNCNRVYEHHIVYCEANGMTEIPKGFCIHHKNHDKLDNRLENLELMSMSEHTRMHQLQRH